MQDKKHTLQGNRISENCNTFLTDFRLAYKLLNSVEPYYDQNNPDIRGVIYIVKFSEYHLDSFSEATKLSESLFKNYGIISNSSTELRPKIVFRPKKAEGDMSHCIILTHSEMETIITCKRSFAEYIVSKYTERQGTVRAYA